MFGSISREIRYLDNTKCWAASVYHCAGSVAVFRRAVLGIIVHLRKEAWIVLAVFEQLRSVSCAARDQWPLCVVRRSVVCMRTCGRIPR